MSKLKLSCDSQDIGKVDFHSTGKNGKTQIFQVYGFLNTSDEAEIHTILKTWKK